MSHYHVQIKRGSLDGMLRYKPMFSNEIILCTDNFKLYIYPERGFSKFRPFSYQELADAFQHKGFYTLPGAGIFVKKNESIGKQLEIPVFINGEEYLEGELVFKDDCLYVSDGDKLHLLLADTKLIRSIQESKPDDEHLDKIYNEVKMENKSDKFFHLYKLMISACYLFATREIKSSRAEYIHDQLVKEFF